MGSKKQSERFRVELFNVCQRGRATGNGWLVADKGPEGRHTVIMGRFEGPDAESKARALAVELNLGA